MKNRFHTWSAPINDYMVQLLKERKQRDVGSEWLINQSLMTVYEVSGWAGGGWIWGAQREHPQETGAVRYTLQLHKSPWLWWLGRHSATRNCKTQVLLTTDNYVTRLQRRFSRWTQHDVSSNLVYHCCNAHKPKKSDCFLLHLLHPNAFIALRFYRNSSALFDSTSHLSRDVFIK